MKSSYGESSIKVLIFLTQISLFATIVCKILTESFDVAKSPNVMFLALIVGYGLILLFITHQNYVVAKFLFFIHPIFFIIVLDGFYFKIDYMIRYNCLFFPMIVPFVFNEEEIKSKIVFSTVPIFVFVGLEYFVHHSLFSQASSQLRVVQFLFLFSLGSLLGSIYLFIFYSKKHDSAQKRLIVELRDKNSEIKVLRGCLPICSSCKKIRDGKGYWNRIDQYIQEHSEAKFSHSLCLDCAKELYGDEKWFDEIEKKLK